MAKRHYSDRDRAAALAILDANAGNYSAAARAAGVPRQSLQAWDKERATAAPPDVRQEEKVSLASLYDGEIRAALDAAGIKRDSASYKELITGVGILADKLNNLAESPVTRIDVTSGGERLTVPQALAVITAYDAKRE